MQLNERENLIFFIKLFQILYTLIYFRILAYITFTSTCQEKKALSHKIDFQNHENNKIHNFFKVINKNDLLVSYLSQSL